MNLYLVHVGFYDGIVSAGGVYESHTNFFVAAPNAQDARAAAKAMDLYKEKRMHIDGIQEINMVGGYKIQLVKDEASKDEDQITPYIFRDLAAPKTA